MKIIVTHASPDWDAIGGVWLLKKYLPGWHNAQVQFVPAGQRLERSHIKDGSDFAPAVAKAMVGKKASSDKDDPVEKIDEDEVIHVDTGMGPLDHHQTSDQNVSGTSRAWDYVRSEMKKAGIHLSSEHEEAASRVVTFIVETDHFKEVFWADPAADHHEFSLLGLLDGLKLVKPNEDDYYVTFGIECLDSMMHQFENRIWAEKEIRENGIAFETKWGKGLGFETINDSVIKLAQKMGNTIVVRKDPRKGYVRIKARPTKQQKGPAEQDLASRDIEDIDLTPVYEILKERDPQATWFLHVSKKMLLNGTPKNPKMIPTHLPLSVIIEILKSV